MQDLRPGQFACAASLSLVHACLWVKVGVNLGLGYQRKETVVISLGLLLNKQSK